MSLKLEISCMSVLLHLKTQPLFLKMKLFQDEAELAGMLTSTSGVRHTASETLFDMSRFAKYFEVLH